MSNESKGLRIQRLLQCTSHAWLVMLYSVCGGVVHAALPDAIQQEMMRSKFTEQGLAIYVQAVNEHKPTLSINASDKLNPASVIKLLTTAAVMSKLGSNYKWSNQIWYQGEIVNRRLKGDLYWKGNGDPYLTPERFWRLLNRITAAGIEWIDGNVYIDDQYFKPDKVDYAAFDGQEFRSYHVGPNAVLVGFQVTEFYLRATESSVVIKYFPDSPNIKLVNQIRLVKGACGAWSKRLNIDVSNHGNQLEVKLSGRYAEACGDKVLYRRVMQAQNHFQHFFLPIWTQLGGKLSGQVKHGAVPSSAKLLLNEYSISMADATQYINKYSNNVMTRQLLLSLAAEEFGAPGTTQKGVEAVVKWLDSVGINREGLELDNGAGLSRETRVTATLLADLLLYIYRQPFRPEYIASLPVSGYDGSLAHRMIDTPLAGRAHIKTGLLDFVQSMAGYVMAKSGRYYVVVMLHNHPRAHTKASERLQDRVIEWVYKNH